MGPTSYFFASEISNFQEKKNSGGDLGQNLIETFSSNPQADTGLASGEISCPQNEVNQYREICAWRAY